MSIKKATFAAGCFWGVQDAFDNTEGVIATTAGYIGGNVANPTYKQVCGGGTGHVEAVQIKYDTEEVSYKKLLDVFWKQVSNITLLALDYPTGQYMPIIFYHDTEQRELAEKSRYQLLDAGKQKYGAMLTDIHEITEFWKEPDEYHQHYHQKNKCKC